MNLSTFKPEHKVECLFLSVAAVPSVPPETFETKVELIRENAILSLLGQEEIVHLAEEGRWAHYVKGDIIWLNGAEAEWFGLIRTGFVKMVKTSEQGKYAVLEIMGAGQTFGCLGVVEGSGCPLSAQCVTDVTLLKIPKQPFLVRYEGNQPLQREMMKISARRFFAKLNLMAKLSSGRVDSRIANVLLLLCESYGRLCGQGLKIDVPLTRQDMSDFTGVTIESAIRTLSAWQKQGIIRSDKSVITILKMDRIEEFAHGE